MAEKLQTELGDPLSKDDLVVGATVIYYYRGTPYEGEILKVKCKLLLFKITHTQLVVVFDRIMLINLAGSEKTIVEESRSDTEEEQCTTASKFIFTRTLAYHL